MDSQKLKELLEHLNSEEISNAARDTCAVIQKMMQDANFDDVKVTPDKLTPKVRAYLKSRDPDKMVDEVLDCYPFFFSIDTKQGKLQMLQELHLTDIGMILIILDRQTYNLFKMLHKRHPTNDPNSLNVIVLIDANVFIALRAVMG